MLRDITAQRINLNLKVSGCVMRVPQAKARSHELANLADISSSPIPERVLAAAVLRWVQISNSIAVYGSNLVPARRINRSI